jgi:SAM-dependent methyltransferase
MVVAGAAKLDSGPANTSDSGCRLRQGCFSPRFCPGIDLVRSPNDHFAEISPEFEFRQHDTDGNPLPFSDHSFDFVSCNHVLEHVFETEKLVREFRRVLSPDGLCIVSVPNIAAWINRVTFLAGGQPLGSGHIRDFTPHGLQDLTKHCGFRTVGWWAQSPGIIARFGKWAGRNMSIILQPAV